MALVRPGFYLEAEAPVLRLQRGAFAGGVTATEICARAGPLAH